MWKFAEPVAENAKAMRDRLMALKPVIPEIMEMEVGIDLSGGDNSYHLALNAAFDSIEGLEKYQKHPEHIKVSDFCKSIRTARAVVDYECQ
jgi:hypothetical protein